MIAATAQFSRQLLDDFSDFSGFVPSELTRAVIDAETDQIVNGDGTSPQLLGLLHTSGVLTRSVGSDTDIDAIVSSFNDIRVGSSYGTADLVVMHPSTWNSIRLEKDSQNRYLLAQDTPNAIGSVHDIFGVRVLTNTKVPAGTAISIDTSKAVIGWTRQGMEVAVDQYGTANFNYNAITFRAEERIAIGVTYPTAICVVTGLPGSGS